MDEQCEVISVLGDVAKDEDGKPSLHLHGVSDERRTHGRRSRPGTARAPQLEVVLTERRLTCVANLEGLVELPSSMSTPANNYRPFRAMKRGQRRISRP